MNKKALAIFVTMILLLGLSGGIICGMLVRNSLHSELTARVRGRLEKELSVIVLSVRDDILLGDYYTAALRLSGINKAGVFDGVTIRTRQGEVAHEIGSTLRTEQRIKVSVPIDFSQGGANWGSIDFYIPMREVTAISDHAGFGVLLATVTCGAFLTLVIGIASIIFIKSSSRFTEKLIVLVTSDSISDDTIVYEKDLLWQPALTTLIASHKDISTLRKREREARGYEAIAKMTQMMAHDVRKPFSSVKMVISAMTKVKTILDVKTIASVAIPEINRSLESVNGLLQDVMEIGSDSQPVTEDVDVCDLIDRALTDSFRMYPDSTVTIHYELHHSTNLDVDRNKMLRVLSNIIGNGLQAMGFQGNLSIATRNITGATPMVEFTLANDGPHIPVEALPKLFDAFFTSGKKGGTGLGLAIAHKIVTAHGGGIFCKSEPEKGVAFVFTLPASASSAAPSRCLLSSNSSDFIKAGLAAQAFDGDTSPEVDETILVESFSASAAQMGRNLVVLIADDERLYREGLVEKLERHAGVRERLEILTATNPFEAIKTGTSDLAIVDVDLGYQEMNGFDVVSQLRNDGNRGIVCTHSNRILASDHKTAIDHGADAFLPKPMSTVHLLKLLCQAVERVKEVEGVDTSPLQGSENAPSEPLKFAFVDDSKSIRMTWKIAWKSGNMVSFGSPEEFWREAEANPDFIESLTCVITDFDFGSMSKENGGTFASQLRKRTRLPVFLASDGDYSVADFNGDIDAILPKQPISPEHLHVAVEKANNSKQSSY